MAGFFKRLFGLAGEQEMKHRLTHPRDLCVGDIIKFSLLEQPDVSNKQFEVTQINTYMYGNLFYPEYILKDSTGLIIFLMVEEEDGEEYIALSKKIPKAQINEIIAQNDMPLILTRGTGTKIHTASIPEGFNGWIVNKYKEVDDNVKGSFLRGDARIANHANLNNQEHFSSYLLEDKAGEFALEIEVYDSGEIELCATVYQDIDAIAEMWPNNQSRSNS